MSNIVGLGYCYWQWASLARAHADGKTEKEKLERALAIFTELKMPIERDALQAELDKVHALDAGLRPRKESASTSENTVI